MSQLLQTAKSIAQIRSGQILEDQIQPYEITIKRVDFDAGCHDLSCESSFTLYAVISGSAESRLWTEDFKIRASLSRGALFTSPGGCTAHMELDRTCKVIAVNFQGQTDRAMLPNWNRIGIQVFRDILVFETILRIHEEALVRDNMSENLMETAASLLMITLDIIDQRTIQGLNPNRPNAHIGMHKAVRWIEDNLDDGLTLNQLAKIAGLSAWHFLRVFKAKYHLSPHNYIKNRRLARAKRMLAETNTPISHIAYDCGFSSQSHLTTTFKQYYGYTPGRYRQSIQKNEKIDEL